MNVASHNLIEWNSFRMQIRLCSHIEKRATLRMGWQPLLLVQIKSSWRGGREREEGN